jgi:hypothetical protein
MWLLAEREMNRMMRNRTEGKSSHSAERRQFVFPTSNMWRIIGFDVSR